jgi:hypothetical protein
MERTRRQAVRPRSGWPAFLFDTEEGTPRFVEEITKAVDAFRFEELPKLYQNLFRDMNTHGRAYVERHLLVAMEMVQAEDPEDSTAHLTDLFWAMGLGSLIFQKVPEAIRAELLPYNDARFHYVDNNIIVEFRSLLPVQRGDERFYYSRLKPSVEVEGSKYTVAFSTHTIDRIKKRISPQWMEYPGLGDVFAYLEQCVYFEQCRLRNVNKSGQQLALTFYNICNSDRMLNWKYVTEVLGEKNLDRNLGIPYHRLGYCPAFIDPGGEFIKLGTLLLPGFRQTPEYGILLASSLPQEEKDRLEAIAIDERAADHAREGDTFAALKWFHENGVLQVIQTKKEIYRTFPKTKFAISKVIQK